MWCLSVSFTMSLVYHIILTIYSAYRRTPVIRLLHCGPFKAGSSAGAGELYASPFCAFNALSDRCIPNAFQKSAERNLKVVASCKDRASKWWICTCVVQGSATARKQWWARLKSALHKRFLHSHHYCALVSQECCRLKAASRELLILYPPNSAAQQCIRPRFHTELFLGGEGFPIPDCASFRRIWASPPTPPPQRPYLFLLRLVLATCAGRSPVASLSSTASTRVWHSCDLFM